MYIAQWYAMCMLGFASTKEEKESEQPFSGATWYVLDELSVAPSIPVISYTKVSDASFTKFSLIPPNAHRVSKI